MSTVANLRELGGFMAGKGMARATNVAPKAGFKFYLRS